VVHGYATVSTAYELRDTFADPGIYHITITADINLGEYNEKAAATDMLSAFAIYTSTLRCHVSTSIILLMAVCLPC
jgi:hypothetical protein